VADRPTLIASVQRALHLLDAVGASSRPLPAKALARQTGERLPTTYHLLRTLVHEGYLSKADGGYRLGERVTALSGLDGTPSVRDRVRPALRLLHEDLGAAAYLAVYRGGEVRLVDVVDSPASPRVDLWVDLEVAGHATALGKAVLAGLDDVARRDYLSRHELADLTPYTVTDRTALLRRLPNQVPDLAGPGEAGTDLVLDRQEYALGIACVAAPVRLATGVGAVAVSVPTERLRRTVDHARDLRRVARLVELELAR